MAIENSKAEIESRVKQYRGLAFALARKSWAIGGYHAVELSDVEQEAMIALWQAAKVFNADRGIAFSTLATTAIRQDLRHFRNKGNTKKNRVLPRGAGGDRPDYIGAGEDQFSTDSKMRESAEHAEHVGRKLWPSVSLVTGPREYASLRLRAEGKTYAEIGKKLGISDHCASANASRGRWKIRTKLKGAISREMAA